MTYDVIIAGGGPAGLSAAVYLGRFLRRTLVVDAGQGRSAFPQINENYLGFPRGVAARRLRELGRRQAVRFGVAFAEGSITAVRREARSGLFAVESGSGAWQARALILATGVTDIWPAFAGAHRYVGRSLFWCITCDGFRTRGQQVLLIGAADSAVTTACQFLRYTDRLTFLAVDSGCSPGGLRTLREHRIAVVEGAIERVEGARGLVRRVRAGGRWLETDLMFSLLGAVPNTAPAAQLGVLLDDTGHIRIDREQRTNVPCVYAAGDVTGPYAHQVTSAVHEGAMAAQAANYDLYEDFQQE